YRRAPRRRTVRAGRDARADATRRPGALRRPLGTGRDADQHGLAHRGRRRLERDNATRHTAVYCERLMTTQADPLIDELFAAAPAVQANAHAPYSRIPVCAPDD